MRIRSLLLLLAAIVLVPSFIAASVAIQKARSAQREAALRGLQETVRATALLVDGQIQHSIGALTSLGNSPSLASGDLRAFYLEAAALDQRPNVWTLLLDDTGTQRINTSVPFGTPPPPPIAKERVTKVLATQHPLVTDLIIGPVTKKLLTTVYVPAKRSDGRGLVVAQAFSVAHWKETALQPQGRSQWIVGIIDHTGKFISRSHRADEMLGHQARAELVVAAAASHDGLIRHRTLEGVDSYDAFTHSDLTGWTIAIAAPVDSIEASATQAVFWLVAGLASAVVLAVAGAWLLSKTLLASIERAADAARALGEGRYPVIAGARVLELNDLNETLGDVANLLNKERRARELAESERADLLNSERTHREAAQAENAAKDRFLALLAHEIRNPLTAISSATQVLTRKRAADPVDSRMHSIIERQSAHLKRIVDDLLEISRLLSGKIVLKRVPLNLGDCLQTCIETFKTTPAAQNMHFVVDLEEAWILGDPVRIEQIVSNILGNAVKFSAPGGSIRIALSMRGPRVQLSIADDGEGIPNELLPHVFEPFVQGASIQGRQSAGLGIGLALVRQLIELHDGHVEAFSAGAGKGAKFVLTMPRLAEVPSSEPSVLMDSAQSGDDHRGRVLLVEDNEDARVSTSTLLRVFGYKVETAEDGALGLRLAKAKIFKVVISDLAMPVMTGYELAVAIRASDSIRHLPLIALSGYGEERDKLASKAAGFDSHLIKPVDADQLISEIERLTATKAAKL